MSLRRRFAALALCLAIPLNFGSVAMIDCGPHAPANHSHSAANAAHNESTPTNSAPEHCGSEHANLPVSTSTCLSAAMCTVASAIATPFTSLEIVGVASAAIVAAAYDVASYQNAPEPPPPRV